MIAQIGTRQVCQPLGISTEDGNTDHPLRTAIIRILHPARLEVADINPVAGQVTYVENYSVHIAAVRVVAPAGALRKRFLQVI